MHGVDEQRGESPSMAQSEVCIFCAIVARTVPCHTVYEDEDILAFMDHRPLNPGHVLVIPKPHEPDFYRLTPELYLAAMHTAQRLGRCLARLYQPPKVGLFIAGFHVPHVHVHVVPLYAMQDLTAESLQRAMRTPPAPQRLVESCQQIRQTLAGLAGTATET
jgi:histidine triad (HIT) family protein